jgi:serine/threonine protein phosphatase PrpC
MRIRPGVELGNLTDVGCHRAENEDYFCYAEPEDDLEFQRKGRLLVVADGMGGHEGGKLASTIAAGAVRDGYLNHPDADPYLALQSAFQDGHAAIQEYSRVHPELRGMGTTCTAVTILNNGLSYGHVGDSRLYLIRGYNISRITRDHSQVERLVQDGLITPEEAAVHPQRNVLTAAMGVEPAAADFSETPLPLEPGDVLLMATDGLHGLVNDQELLASTATQAPAEACKELVRMAKERGGFDNITVQILKIM